MGKNVGRILTGGVAGKSSGLDKFVDPMGLFKDPEVAQIQTPDKSYFDVTKEAGAASTAYAPLLTASQAQSAASTPYQTDVLKQMGLAATGQGPSLAEAQMKAAQDRNLSQQLAAIQAQRGGSTALNQRSLLQNMAGSGRDLAQQAGIARLEERNNFLNQANVANQNLRTDITGKLNLDVMPKQALQQWETMRTGNANTMAANQLAAQNAQKGALMGAIGSIAGTYFGGPAGGAAGGKLGAALGSGGNQQMPVQYADGGEVKSGTMPKGCYENGGPVKGPGTGISDSIDAKVSNGEFVVKAAVAQKPGMIKFLEKLNSGKVKESDVAALARALSKKQAPKRG